MYRITIGRVEHSHGIFVGVDFEDQVGVDQNWCKALASIIAKSLTEPQVIYTLDLHRQYGDYLPRRSMWRRTIQNGVVTKCDESRIDALKSMAIYYTEPQKAEG